MTRFPERLADINQLMPFTGRTYYVRSQASESAGALAVNDRSHCPQTQFSALAATKLAKLG